MNGVPARLVVDIDEDSTPGAFEFYTDKAGGEAGIVYNCPCGCGRQGPLNFRPGERPSWQWNGDREKPTLQPSVHHLIGGVTHWHGYLTAGEWKSC